VTKEEIKYQWISLPQWQRILIISILMLSLAYLFYFFMIAPQKQKVNQLKLEVDSLQKQVAKLRQIAKPEKLRELNQKIISQKKELQQIKQEIEKLESRIPPKPDFEELVYTISNIFSKNGMEIKDLGIKKEKTIYVYKEGKKLVFYQEKKVEQQKKAPNQNQKKEKKEELKLQEVPITVETSGSIRSLKDALGDFASSERFLSVESIALEKDKKGIISSKVFIKTYYLPEKK